jgi:hypothetical protein
LGRWKVTTPQLDVELVTVFSRENDIRESEAQSEGGVKK